MKSKINRLAAAAMILIAVGIIVVSVHSTQPAWAIEQTIETLKKKNIETIYVSGIRYYAGGVCGDFEAWLQRSSKDSQYFAQVGQNLNSSGNLRLDEKGFFISVVQEKENTTCTYTYDIKNNTVKIQNGSYHTYLWLGHEFFRELKSISQGWTEECGKDEETAKECVFVKGFNEAMSQSWWIEFDVESKLPVRAKLWTNAKSIGKPLYECNKIIFNPKLPDGIFDFVMPDGAKVIDERKNSDSGQK